MCRGLQTTIGSSRWVSLNETAGTDGSLVWRYLYTRDKFERYLPCSSFIWFSLNLQNILLFFCVIQNLLKISRPSGYLVKHQDDKKIDKNRDGEGQPQPEVGHHHPGKHGLWLVKSYNKGFWLVRVELISPSPPRWPVLRGSPPQTGPGWRRWTMSGPSMARRCGDLQKCCHELFNYIGLSKLLEANSGIQYSDSFNFQLPKSTCTGADLMVE